MIGFVFVMVGGTVVVIFIWAFASMSAKEKRVNKAADDIRQKVCEKFPQYANCEMLGGEALCLFIDEENRTALVANREFAKEIPFSDFVAAHILTDGMTAAETRKEGIAGRTIAGGLIGGGAGAIVGALSARSIQNSINVTTSIQVIVETIDEQFPSFGWSIFSPEGLMQDLKPYEVWPYMEKATARYNALAPIFRMHATEENGLVAL